MKKALETIDNAIEILNQTRSMFFADHTVYGGFKKSDFNKAINGLTIISAKLEEAMKPKTCEEYKGFIRYDYCSIIDDDCRVVFERCNGCKSFLPKDNA